MKQINLGDDMKCRQVIMVRNNIEMSCVEMPIAKNTWVFVRK